MSRAYGKGFTRLFRNLTEMNHPGVIYPGGTQKFPAHPTTIQALKLFGFGCPKRLHQIALARSNINVNRISHLRELLV